MFFTARTQFGRLQLTWRAARASAGHALRVVCSLWLAHWFLSAASVALGAGPTNLALNKPASSSSIENDEHSAAQANDGDPKNLQGGLTTNPKAVRNGGRSIWAISFDLSGCQIRWPYDGKNYRYKVEGSADRKTWSMLSDQQKNDVTVQVHKLKFNAAAPVRYVKVTVTGLDEGCWASICEVKVFGSEHSTGASK